MKSKISAVIKAFLWGCVVILFPVVSGVIAVTARLGTIESLVLQGSFMVISLVIPLALILSGKWKARELGFGKFDLGGCKKALFFLPLLLVYVPVLTSGFYIKSAAYVLCSAFLYLFVGIAEEVYFRGIVPKYLGKDFSRKGVVLISSLIFGIGHLATAFSGGGALETALTVLNAFLFGWLAIEAALLSGNILIPIMLHFLFDFETKIVAMNGSGLLMAELVRGTLLCLGAIWLMLVLIRQKKEPETLGAEEKKKRKKIIIGLASGLCAGVLVAVIVVTSLLAYGKSQTKKIPPMTFSDCLEYTLKGSEGVITVGIIKGGEASYKVYGTDGKELPSTLHTYEIGSLTKTFTAALIEKAVEEGKLSLSDTVDRFFTLPEENRYPTISELLTHTSGYKGYYFEMPMVGNFFAGRNDFCGISGEEVLAKLALLDTEESPFLYSNYGYAVLGMVLEKVFGADYAALVNGFASDIGMLSTHISDGGDLDGYWEWRENDAYMPAGALTSNIEDMLKYARLQLDGAGVFRSCHKVVKKIDASSADNKAMDINTDEIGMAWITDTKNGIIWHNGGTTNFNSYLGFCPEKGTAVVILSNLSPDYRIPATVMGVKLLKELGAVS